MRAFLVNSSAILALVAATGFIDVTLSTTRPRHVFKRDAYGTPILNNVFYYTAEVGVGTPPQMVNVVLDTGSSDLWVMKSSNPYCSGNGATLCQGKVFTPDNSSTFSLVNEPFAIKYGDYSSASGEWAHDDLEFAGITLKDAKFALADTSNSTQIVMGVGLTSLESTVSGVDSDGTEEGTYKNIPQLFKDQGYIERVIYSLWLNDIDSQGGNILFGAVDDSKYYGDLTILPIVNLSHKLKTPYSFHIMMNGISVQSGDKVEKIADLSYPALLDSGTSFAYLPPVLVESLANQLGYELNLKSGYYTGPCDAVTNQTVLFNFSGKDIPIPFSSLTMPYSLKEPGVCALVVLPSHSEYSTILGDVFLREVYAVFDLENYEIGIAPAKVNITETNINVITNKMPGVRAPLYNTTMAVQNITLLDDALSNKLNKEKIRNSASNYLPNQFIAALALLI